MHNAKISRRMLLLYIVMRIIEEMIVTEENVKDPKSKDKGRGGVNMQK